MRILSRAAAPPVLFFLQSSFKGKGLPSRRLQIAHQGKTGEKTMNKPLSIFAFGAALVSLSSLGATQQASADAISDFYKNTTMTLVIGTGPGGGYDLYARLISTHMSRHIPGNPKIVPKNMPGSGAIRAANFSYNVAKQDGSVIVGVHRTTPFAPIFGHKGPKFDSAKFQWLGSLNNEAGVVRVRVDTGVKNIADARRKVVIMGSTAPGTDTTIYPALLNNTLGTKFRSVTGYMTGPSVDLAIERNEVQGQTDSVSSMQLRWPNWRKQFYVLAQLSLTKHPSLPNVPVILDLIKPGNLPAGLSVEEAKTIWRIMLTQKVMGRPFAMGPGVPANKVKVLRTAFRKMLADPVFIADAKRQKREVVAVDGDAIQKLIAQAVSAPKPLIAKLKDALKYKGKVEKAKITFVKDTGKVIKTQRGGRAIIISKGGKKLKARVSGRSTKVFINGKKAKRKAVKIGMTCTFTYPGPGQQAKEVNCKM
jgi:tripartite-type tricarboxylate transporter receptor subunit TctC